MEEEVSLVCNSSLVCGISGATYAGSLSNITVCNVRFVWCIITIFGELLLFLSVPGATEQLSTFKCVPVYTVTVFIYYLIFKCILKSTFSDSSF